MEKKKNRKIAIIILKIAFTIGFISFIIWGFRTSGQDSIKVKRKLAINNTHKGRVISIIYKPRGDTLIYVSGDPVSGAIAGGGTAAILGCGTVGIILGAAIGADSEKSKTEYNPTHESQLIIITVAGNDTSYFEILYEERKPCLELANKFKRDTTPTHLMLVTALKVGSIIRIVSLKPLSKMNTVSSDLIYLEGENIPFIDP